MRKMGQLIAANAGMLIGGMLYIVSRHESLVMFRWFDMMGLHSEVRTVRSFAGPYLTALPPWTYFSLPQALWYLSGLSSLEFIWGHSTVTRRQRRAWVGVLSVLALGMEGGQFMHWVPGRFDLIDLLLLGVAGSTSRSIWFLRSASSPKTA